MNNIQVLIVFKMTHSILYLLFIKTSVYKLVTYNTFGLNVYIIDRLKEDKDEKISRTMKVFRPWAFQGSLSRKNYFEGWYFKHVSSNMEDVWSFIPGIALSPEGRHSFIQVLNGRTGASQLFEYGAEAFSASRRKLNVNVGNSHFTTEGITLDLKNRAQRVSGSISYTSLDEYPSTLIKPGIMGWYSFVPFMECKHGVVSMHHKLNGGLHIDNAYVDFDGGAGYIEKDWGSSFPDSWIWLHCNTFNASDASFTFSVAKIPWLGSFFIGFISYLKFDGRFFNFSTWSKARIKKLAHLEGKLMIQIVNKDYQLEIEAINQQTGILKAPELGAMTRIIKETVDAKIWIRLCEHSGKILFEDRGTRAGMELIDRILTYF